MLILNFKVKCFQKSILVRHKNLLQSCLNKCGLNNKSKVIVIVSIQSLVPLKGHKPPAKNVQTKTIIAPKLRNYIFPIIIKNVEAYNILIKTVFCSKHRIRRKNRKRCRK